ncbi:MAG TPA: hypothetical protein PK585_06255 [Amphiplicatus sp.]|nr:hypothetical protein [Amphiplicatus sp.]
MVFALIRSGNDNNQSNEKQRRNSLAGWLGRKQSSDSEPTQEVDTAAGLNRVLRMASPSAEGFPSYADPIREALASIESALYAIDSVREVIDQAYEVVLSAQNVEDAGGRALLAESYDELRQQITKIIDELDERAASLLGKNQHNLEVKLGGKAQYSISPTRMDLSSRGLNLEPPRDAFATFDEITAVLGELDSALNKADRAAAGYCRDAQFLIARLAKDSAA